VTEMMDPRSWIAVIARIANGSVGFIASGDDGSHTSN
jgi:hypothetical protein